MKTKVLLLAAFACMLSAADKNSCKKQVVCYYTSWSIYRPSPAKYGPSDVDPNKCTIINYAFAGLWGDTGTLRVLDPSNDFGQLKSLVALKKQNRALKVLISIGGWNEGSVNYSHVAANATLRKHFVTSVVSFVKKNRLDGADMDWEYPTRRGGRKADRENFSILLQELKAGLKAANPLYILTAAVLGAGKEIAEIYDVPTISHTLDYINLMLYDFRVPSEVKYTFQAASVRAFTTPNDVKNAYSRVLENWNLSVIKGIEAWISSGADAKKIILGIPFYGRSWTLANSSDHGLYAPATGPGIAGNLTREAGVLSYQEICLYRSKWTLVRDREVVSPYKYFKKQWVSFDDPKSVAFKAEIVKRYVLGGAMTWELGFDDFKNSCGGGKYPLLSAINDAFCK